MTPQRKRELLRAYTEDHAHVKDINTLVEVLCGAFEKLAPIMTEETRRQGGLFLIAAKEDIARYVAAYISETTKEEIKAIRN